MNYFESVQIFINKKTKIILEFTFKIFISRFKYSSNIPNNENIM
jgi:hypothetical protein